MKTLRIRYRHKHDIGEPFYVQEVYSILNKLDGVSDVQDVDITRKIGDKYSDIGYDIEAQSTPDGRFIMAPQNVVLEVKYPFEDIKGSSI